ncbi:uncharacterized protein LOC129238075 [Anastrepha obliqua]|uniref:uncharacterized protein LOC129238075 n=1 Tax=Anastrepha obliqua TaxID=95512 RepID=UPI00240A491F|nr:uncharacterized protein LOC129238075 [Anastrepha obliqua]
MAERQSIRNITTQPPTDKSGNRSVGMLSHTHTTPASSTITSTITSTNTSTRPTTRLKCEHEHTTNSKAQQTRKALPKATKPAKSHAATLRSAQRNVADAASEVPKANAADFSAFDFNDSSDNSDIQTRPPSYLSRANVQNNTSSGSGCGGGGGGGGSNNNNTSNSISNANNNNSNSNTNTSNRLTNSNNLANNTNNNNNNNANSRAAETACIDSCRNHTADEAPNLNGAMEQDDEEDDEEEDDEDEADEQHAEPARGNEEEEGDDADEAEEGDQVAAINTNAEQTRAAVSNALGNAAHDNGRFPEAPNASTAAKATSLGTLSNACNTNGAGNDEDDDDDDDDDNGNNSRHSHSSSAHNDNSNASSDDMLCHGMRDLGGMGVSDNQRSTANTSSNHHNNNNNNTADALLMAAIANASASGTSNGGAASDMCGAMPTTATTESNNQCAVTSGATGVGTLLDGVSAASNGNNCNEIARSSSASLSNNSSSATALGGGSGVGGDANSIGGGGGGNGSICGGVSGVGGGGGIVSGIGGESMCGGAPSEAGSAAGTTGSGHSERKKYRHQNYSKNIYIGTKNAEKWEHTRTRLQFKNDVEFVTYLLNLADNDTERLANLPPPSAPTTPTKSFANNFKLEPNLSVKEFGKSQTENSNEATPAPARRKYKKRVQFSDALNGFPKMKDFSNFSAKAKKQDQKMKSATSGSGSTNDTLPEVLDCRIAEKIKSELEEKSATKIPPHQNALCLKKPGEGGDMEQQHNSDEDEDDEAEADTGIGTASATTAVAVATAATVAAIGDVVDANSAAATPTLSLNAPSAASTSNFRARVKGKRGPKNVSALPVNSAFSSLGTSIADEEEDELDGDTDGDDDDEEMDEEALAREMKNEQNFVEEEDEHDIAFRSQQSCRECSITHDYKICPLRTAIGTITDAVDLAEWIERKNLEALAKLKHDAQRQAKQDHDPDDEDMDETSQMSELETKPLITFAEASVPAEFELHNVEPNVTGVFARTEVRAFTKLGPLIGQPVQSSDVREGSDMKWIFEICEAGAEKSELLACDNPNTSNWLRYIRPAPTFDERNVNLVSIERHAFFVTCRDVKNGMELLYWSDDCNTMWRKKHTEKTNCGGCNLRFDHPLYYRTHCSIFHDPSMSLTIRKYHCKVCGEAVLGKDNIMKHAAEKHEGKGAYQCQFCNKFFLRLNYLEMHRTYGCAANPNRARPLCDFCGRKFCQPQKLKAHIKRMHSDMAEVLRDFQCKLCSKLLGSRAALQRHSKEVHSRNSTVVSCPRCQKLFQNRSNLKIHMLTHSGVRPFKCSEPECNAAFTTKQCLQFHYKKVHNYTQEQMPKIERSVAYTFDAYSGGMKVDFLEQAPRRRRKSLEDQNSRLSSSMQSDTEFSDDNIFEAIKKSGKSIKDLCRNEPNLSLLSSKISSIFGEKVVGSRKRKKKKEPPAPNMNLMGAGAAGVGVGVGVGVDGTEEEDEDEHMEQVRRKQANAQLSLVESFLTTTAQRLTAQHQVQQVVAAAAAVSAMAGAGAATATEDPNKMHMMSGLNSQHHAMAMGGHAVAGMLNDDDDEDDDEDDNGQDDPHDGGHGEPHDDNNSYRHHTSMNALGQNLVVSKGSKKWISGDDHHLTRDCAASVDRCGMGGGVGIGGGVGTDAAVAAAMGGAAAVAAACSMTGNGGGVGVGVGNDMGLPPFAVPPNAVDDASKLIGHNRDFLARLMNSASANHAHHNNRGEEDENSSFLDVVESNNNNNNGSGGQMQQYHHNGGGAGVGGSIGAAVNVANAGNANANNMGGTGANSTPSHQTEDAQLQMNSLAHSQSFMSSFYNNANARLSGGGSASTSASMLVEAALNSVGNMIDSENNDMKVANESNINTDSPMSAHHVDTEANRFSTDTAANHHSINSIDNLENELKMMKNLSNFPMQIPPLPMFPNSGNNMTPCNISPNASTPTNPQSNQNNNDVDVDAGSTPRPQHLSGSAADSDGFSSGHHRTPPSPQPISPGRDYGMFSNANATGANGTPGGPGTAGSNSSGNSVSGNSNNNISASSPLPTMQAHRRNASSVGSAYPDHELISPASSPSIPRYNFNGEMMRHKRAEHESDRRQTIGHNPHLSSDEENSIIPQNSSGQDMRMKFSQSQMDLMYTKYESMAANAANLKYNSQELDSPADYRSANSNTTSAPTANDLSDLQGLDMSRSSVSASNYHHNFQLPGSASSNIPGIGRYHHHIYDILSEREQQTQQAQTQQQQHHSSAVAAAAAVAAQHQQQQEHSSQLVMQQHQSAMHNMLPDQLGEQDHDQTTSVDLSRTANYVVPSPPQLPYNHPHHDMLRMASLDLTPNTNMSVGNNRSFLSSQMQHQSRESLEHHRLLSTVEQHRILAASNVAADQHRLLVDPTAHLLMEQNNRLLGTDQSRLLGETAQNRHMARSFGAYHQVASGNYHPSVRPPVLPSANHHASNPSNYHPFPAYY